MGVNKVKSGEQTDNEEKYQGIRECEEKSGDEVFPIGICRFGGSFERSGWSVPEEIDSIYYQNEATDNLEHILIGFNKVCNKRESESGQHAVNKVGKGSSHDGE